MDLQEFKKEHIRTELGLDNTYGRILIIIDFGNVDYWFEEDQQDADGNALAEDEKLTIDLDKIREFCSLFSENARFYYGHDAERDSSLRFIIAAKHVFGGSRVFSKPMQKIRHHLKADEIDANKRILHEDGAGAYVYLHKCNFDVEITVDSIRLMKNYDTLMLFSSDADFVSLFRFLCKKGNDKKVILVKGGHITSSLRELSNKVISAQTIKRQITRIVKKKQKPGS